MTETTEADDFVTFAELADSVEEGDTLRVSLTGGYTTKTDRVVEGDVVSTDYVNGHGQGNASAEVALRGHYVSDDDTDQTLYFFVAASDKSPDAITVGAAKSNKRRDYVTQHTRKGDPEDTVVEVADADDGDADKPAHERARRNLDDAAADVTDPFALAVNEPMNDDDRHVIRFVSTRDDGADFDFATGLAEWFEPDRIVAEHYDVVDDVRDALDVLRERADLRTVANGRHGAFVVDPDTGTVESVEIHGHMFDFADDSDTVDRVGRDMLAKFEDADDDSDEVDFARRHPTGVFKPTDVSFDPYAIAAAWEAADDVPVCVAVAITTDFTNIDVRAADGEKADGDVVFGDVPGDGVHFEEKAVGVCDRSTAEDYAPAWVDLPDRDDGKVLAVNTHQIFD